MNSRTFIAQLLILAAAGACIGGFVVCFISVTVGLLMIGSHFPLVVAGGLMYRWDELRAVAKGDYDYY